MIVVGLKQYSCQRHRPNAIAFEISTREHYFRDPKEITRTVMALTRYAHHLARHTARKNMIDAIPEGARPVARVLLVGPGEKVFLLHAEHAGDGHRFWLTPGGGLEPHESFEDAARRELWEETGLDVQVGHWVWTRRHAYFWKGRWCDQYERFFVATTDDDRIRPINPDDYVVGHRWWNKWELGTSHEDFVPRRLLELAGSIIEGQYPDTPIECGV